MRNLALGIVDDDEGTLYTVKAMIETLGHKIYTTTDPEVALGWVKNKLIDILLVDYHMPVMSGLDVIRAARKLSEAVILLALTVEESPQVAHELLTVGADDFILKPLRLADFSARISLHAELLRYRRYENPEGIQKGLSENTTRRVYLLFLDGSAMTASEASEKSGLAYPTVYRYLEYLVKKGQLNRRSVAEDGRSGRPSVVYSCLPLQINLKKK
ncbi:MAG: response regulator [Pyramidobacter sp.]|uniref:response regulator n=1 Tax=Pyramidobacter sp. TaxID=1943581 RepID=UPI002A8146E8|nr:response regulator [Pyramidobacter sp.]MDY4032819.1 response regulator [Pyramidobacter sp.]